MKIRIKLYLYVLKEHFIATFAKKKKKNGEGLSKVVKWLLKCGRGRSPNIKLIPGMTTFSMKDCLASLVHRTDKCIDVGS